MTDRLVIELDAEGELLRRIDQAILQIANPDELMESIGAVLESNIQSRFDAKVDPSGAPWAPLSPATLAGYERASKGNVPGSLLERTRQMRDSLTFTSGSDFVEVGMTRLTNSAEWNVATLHEYGTEKMPRRGLLTADPVRGELGAGDRADILAEVERFLADALR